MKVINILLIMSLFLIPAFANAVEKKLEKDILLNPGFENEQQVDYWATDGNVTFIWTETWRPHSGNWAFGIGNDLDWAQDKNWGRCLQVLCDPVEHAKLFSVREGEIINFSMFIMAEDGYNGKASLKLEFFGYDRRNGFSNAPLAFYQSKSYTSGFDWTKIKVSGAAPKGTVSVAVSCLSDNMAKGSKYVWFDDGSVTKAVPY